MRFLLLTVIVALTVTDVSGGRWWRRVKSGARDLWRQHKGTIISHGVKLLLAGRSIEDVDLNGDGILTEAELKQHMEQRDADDLLHFADEQGDRRVTRDVMERYVQEALLDTSQ
ncbi:uncharacterized protein LOC124128708 [Haliotis rufescens]|uniref:uncharacterized protein LOC124128708 n=1 Tax=Haliotis rufescens TaxID=6454 RepID=UPI00201F38B9|nr:uncharacterized protein LOC124128708 [Haliotis rufescens]